MSQLFSFPSKRIMKKNSTAHHDKQLLCSLGKLILSWFFLYYICYIFPERKSRQLLHVLREMVSLVTSGFMSTSKTRVWLTCCA